VQCDRLSRLLTRLVVDYFICVVQLAAPTPRVARRRLHLAARLLVARAHRLYCVFVVHPNALFRRSTTHRSVTLALAVRPVTPSRGLATRHPVAPALLRLCHASGRAVSPLNFSSVGCIGSRRAPGHSVSWLDCVVAQFLVRSQWLYFSHAMRRDYLSHGNADSTSTEPCAVVTSSCGHISSTSTTPCAAVTSSFGYIASTTHLG
jgi:hypothetical protein